jgi:hypothetical protein
MKRTRHVAGHEFAADLPARVCAACGTSYFDDPVVGQFDALVAVKLAEAGVTEPAALQFMRKVTGLQGKEFAELLAVRPETVSQRRNTRERLLERVRSPVDPDIYPRHSLSLTIDFASRPVRPDAPGREENVSAQLLTYGHILPGRDGSCGEQTHKGGAFLVMVVVVTGVHHRGIVYAEKCSDLREEAG